MKTKHQYLLLLYWGVLLADAYFTFKVQDANRIFTKPLLMPLLIIYFIVNAPKQSQLLSRILPVIALFFAWLGDIFLMQPQPGQSNLAISMFAFMLMHITFSISFLRINKLFPIRKPLNLLIALFFIGIYDTGLMYFLISRAEHFEIMILVYTIVISVMFMLACNVRGSNKAGSLASQFFIPGAVFFLGSDSIYGLNIFLLKDQNIIEIAGTLTYSFAQILMVQGFIKHVRGKMQSTDSGHFTV